MKHKMIEYYMDIAERTSQLSYAEKLKVGSIAVKNDRIISIGYNGTPAGWDNKCEDIDGMTVPFVSHSEENLLTKLAKSNESSEGCSVFITHSPCQHCAKLLYNAGVKTVYYKQQYRLTDGIDFLRKVGVEVIKVGVEVDPELTENKRKILDALGNVTIHFNNEDKPNILTVEDEDGKLHFYFNDDTVTFIENRITLTVDNMVTYLQLEDTFGYTSDNDFTSIE